MMAVLHHATCESDSCVRGFLCTTLYICVQLEQIDYYNPDIILGCETWLSNLDSQLLDIQLNLEICIVSSVHLTDGSQTAYLSCAYRPPSLDTYFNNKCDMITETAGKYPNAIYVVQGILMCLILIGTMNQM